MALSTIGIDAGGTLIKAAYFENDRLHVKKYTYKESDSFFSWLQFISARPQFIMTGGRAAQLQSRLSLDSCRIVGEFEAVPEGVRHLLKQDRHLLREGFILVNIGTGTSIHYISNTESERMAGTGIGGGTLSGLAALMTGEQDFN